MKIRIVVALLLFAFTVQAQTTLQEMVHTEQAFARMAEEKNTRDAFVAPPMFPARAISGTRMAPTKQLMR